MEKHSKVDCPYCGGEARLVGGEVIYPHRPDLYEKKFWLCLPCNAYVGCHPVNPKFGQDGTRPLGKLANAELRRAKSAAHRIFDPLWKSGRFKTRREAYRWLAEVLDMPVDKCHIGYFSVPRCEQVVKVCRELLNRGGSEKRKS